MVHFQTAFALAVFISSQLLQQSYQQSPGMPVPAGTNWESFQFILKTLDSSKASPFYQNEMRISKLVKRFVNLKQDDKALDLMKRVIVAEKSWRFQLCSRLFGRANCQNKKINPEPFFIWRHQVMHTLLDDPTQEIIERVRFNINSSIQ